MGKVAKAFIFLLATYSVQVNDSCLVNNSCYCNDTKIQCIKPQCMQVSFCPDLKVVANLLDACWGLQWQTIVAWANLEDVRKLKFATVSHQEKIILTYNWKPCWANQAAWPLISTPQITKKTNKWLTRNWDHSGYKNKQNYQLKILKQPKKHVNSYHTLKLILPAMCEKNTCCIMTIIIIDRKRMKIRMVLWCSWLNTLLYM